MSFFTFFAALLVSIGSEAVMRFLDNMLASFFLLIFIIIIGIVFDTIGTAATAAVTAPFNAQAAKKVLGAKQAVKITQNADVVANYCNDVIGDIAGIVSGALGAAIIFTLMGTFTYLDLSLTGATMTSFVAALTVGGKAVGKSVAVNNANDIILQVGRIMAWWEKITGMKLFRYRR